LYAIAVVLRTSFRNASLIDASPTAGGLGGGPAGGAGRDALAGAPETFGGFGGSGVLDTGRDGADEVGGANRVGAAGV